MRALGRAAALAQCAARQAEVQNVLHDGAVSLHTRSLKYGKVRAGPSGGC